MGRDAWWEVTGDLASGYCLAGDTPILLADGRERALVDLRVGDPTYGTVRHGPRRRHLITEVLAHWPARKRAYRVSLADGTRLVASAEHRFLTPRGWKQVAPGSRPRPADRILAPADTLVGRQGGAGPLAQALLGPRHELTVHRVEDLGEELPMYDITTGTGDFIAGGVVAHNCHPPRRRRR